MMLHLQEHFQALGLMLVHFCWEGAIIAAVARLVDLALPGLHPRTRYDLSLAALLAMSGAAVLTFVYEDLRLTQAPAGLADLPVMSGAALPKNLDLTQVLPWLDAFWAAGVLLLSLRTLIGLWSIHRLSLGAINVPDDLARRFARAVRATGLSHVRIRMHPAIEGPFVVGLFRSVVYLPLSAVTTLSPDQIDAVLAHELEHIRRADFAWNLLQSAIETLFFYHPAVWWLGRNLREQRELACDDAAVRSCQDPLTYATALLSLEEQRRVAPHLSMALNGHDSGPSLLSRIGRILGETGMKSNPRKTAAAPRPAFLAVPLVLAMLAAFAIPAAQVAASTEAAAKKQCKIKASEAVQPAGPVANLGASDAPKSATGPAPGNEQSDSDESPAAEATDADVAPDNFWAGVMPKGAKAPKAPAKAPKAKAWSTAAWNTQQDWGGQKAWSTQSWSWVKQAQEWAVEATAFSDDADIRQANVEALREAAEDARHQADAMQSSDARQAAQMRIEANQMARNADAMEADAKAMKVQAEAQRRSARDMARNEARNEARNAEMMARNNDAARRQAEAAIRNGDVQRARQDALRAQQEAMREMYAVPPAPPEPPAAPSPAPEPTPPAPPSPPSAPAPVGVHFVHPVAITTKGLAPAPVIAPIKVQVGGKVYKVTVKTEPVISARIETRVVVTTNADS